MAEYLDTSHELIMTGGALCAKVKTLMTLLCDALLTHESRVSNVAGRASAIGATGAETGRGAFWMGGLPALLTLTEAFRS